jgi:prepilin-type N-terminal cleavage/methylation domain-containing protein/prepilin-type processing-associated H-X9-DG protein
MRRGFTLLELLVVIGIIALLIAVTLPVLRQAKMHGQATQSSNNLRQIVAANLAYANDQDCYAPADDVTNNRRWCGARTSEASSYDPTKGYLSPYLGQSRMITPDPLFTDMIKGSASFENGAGGYGYNEVYIGGTPAWGYNADGSRISSRPSMVPRPSLTIMFATTAYALSNGVQEYPFCEPPFWDFGDGPIGYRPSPSLHFRFNGMAIVGWCDGHITMERKGPRDVGDDPNGGNADAQNLGWFGPDDENGYWNPNRSFANSPGN